MRWIQFTIGICDFNAAFESGTRAPNVALLLQEQEPGAIRAPVLKPNCQTNNGKEFCLAKFYVGSSGCSPLVAH